MGPALLNSGAGQQAAAGAPGPVALRGDNPVVSPADALVRHPPPDQVDDESDDPSDVASDNASYDSTDDDVANREEDSTYNRAQRKLMPLTSRVRIAMMVLLFIIAACIGRELLIRNAPQIVNFMGWGPPAREYPSAGRIRVASAHLKVDVRNICSNKTYSVELSVPNMTSIYPERDLEHPENLSEVFQDLEYNSRKRLTSVPFEVVGRPTLITYPLEKNATSDHHSTAESLVHPTTSGTTRNGSSV